MPLEHIHGGDIYGASEKLCIAKDRIIDFSANINPLGPPPGVIKAINDNLHMLIHYPDPYCRLLKNELSQYLGINEDYLLLGNGAAELIYLLVRILNCRRAVIPVPTFTEYGIAVITGGGIIEEFPLKAENNFDLEVDALVELLLPGDLVFICNPNNPTGNLYPRDELEYLLAKANSKNVKCVVDEAFIDFVPDYKNHTMIPQVMDNDNLYVFYSLTKFFGIPALRLGAIIAPPLVIQKMAAAKDPWSVNLFAQVGGLAALQDKEHMINTRILVDKERQYLYDKLTMLPGIYPHPGTANFLLINIEKSGLACEKLTELLGKRGILVRDCSSFSRLGNKYIRIAVKNREENNLLIDELSMILEG